MNTEARLPQSMQDLTHEVVTADSNGIDYDVWTWRPPGYEQGDQPYPVLFVLDGAMFMGTAIETVSVMSTIGEAKPAILVGVSTAPPGCTRDPADHRLLRRGTHGRGPRGGARHRVLLLGNVREAVRGSRDAVRGRLRRYGRVPRLPGGADPHGHDIPVSGRSRRGRGGGTLFGRRLRGGHAAAQADSVQPVHRRVVRHGRAGANAARTGETVRRHGGNQASPRVLRIRRSGRGRPLPHAVHRARRRAAASACRPAIPSLDVTIRRFDRETHGSVFAHIFSSGYRELWGTGISFVEAMRGVSIDL